MKVLNNTQLNFKTSAEAWSILQCIEHLNLYGGFYLPEIERQVLAAKRTTTTTIFKSGLTDNYFANLMQAKHGKIKR